MHLTLNGSVGRGSPIEHQAEAQTGVVAEVAVEVEVEVVEDSQ